MLIQLLGSYSDSQSKPTLTTIRFDYREDDIDPLSFQITELLKDVIYTIFEPGFGEYIDLYIDGEKVLDFTK